LQVCFIVLSLLAIAMAWRWTPLGEWVNFAAIVDWQESVRGTPVAFSFVVGAYLAGGLVLFPVTVLNVATVLTFGPFLGNIYALAGWLASGALGYSIGRAFGYKPVKALAPRWLEQWIQAGSGGFMTVLTLRVVPLAPFTLVNFAFGAWRIRFWDFLTASIVGRIPGIILLALAGVQVENLLRQPGPVGIVLLVLTLALAPFVLNRLTRHLLSRGETPAGSANSAAPTISSL
jgi:phospholipase D1/2